MKDNLGCVLNGHKPRYFGIYKKANGYFQAICLGCDEEIELINREDRDTAEWILTSDV